MNSHDDHIPRAGYQIRKATNDDLPHVVPLAQDVLGMHIREHPKIFRAISNAELIKTYQDRLKNGWVMLVAADGTKILGYLLFHRIDVPTRAMQHPRRRADLTEICIAPDSRRNGIGTALGEEFKRLAAKEPLDEITTNYWVFNAPSAALMAKLGFSPDHVTTRIINSADQADTPIAIPVTRDEHSEKQCGPLARRFWICSGFWFLIAITAQMLALAGASWIAPISIGALIIALCIAAIAFGYAYIDRITARSLRRSTGQGHAFILMLSSIASIIIFTIAARNRLGFPPTDANPTTFFESMGQLASGVFIFAVLLAPMLWARHYKLWQDRDER